MSLIAATPAAEEPAMIVPQIPAYKIELTEGSLAEKRAAIETLQEIVAVESVKDRDNALAALSLARGNLKKFTESKDELKEPALRICQKIDALARDYGNSIKVEMSRVEALTNGYQTKCDAVAEELRRQEVAEIAHENAIAAAQNNIERLRENALREAELNQKPKTEGAIHKSFFDYDILPGGLLELAQQRPDLVSIEPRRREILAAISNGALLPGLRVYKRTTLNAKAS